MTRIISIFLIAILLSPTVGAQTFASGSGKRYGQQLIPIFRSKKDSMRLASLDVEMERLLSSRSGRSKIDSIFQLRSKLYNEVVVGTRRIFYPGREFISSDSVAKMKDKANVRKISVSNVREIPSLVYACENVEAIEFVNTDLQNIPQELNRLPKLKTLYVYNNHSRTRLKLDPNNTVTSLVIRGDDPRKFPRSYKNFESLAKLDLSENDLRKFPNGARHNKQLRELHLQRNLLTLRGTVRRHPYLEQLLLQFNQVRHVPSSIARFPNLRRLTFNTNKVETVSPRIRKLKKLEHLSFYKNALTEIPSGVYRLEALKEIDLFYNKIKTLDPEFAQWKNLHSLYLSYNQLESLPENINQLRSLEGLYVWENRLTSLPSTIGEMPMLKFVRVNGNYLKSLPGSILQLNIQELNISNNYITEIPIELFSYPQLKILVMENNPWNEKTRSFIYQKADDLRKKDVFVHLTNENTPQN